jgi:hypothetical protein
MDGVTNKELGFTYVSPTSLQSCFRQEIIFPLSFLFIHFLHFTL